MKRSAVALLVAMALSSLVAVAPAAWAATVSINPSDDSYVVQNDPASTHGGEGILRVKSFLFSTNTGLKSPTAYTTGRTGFPCDNPERALVNDVPTGSTDDDLVAKCSGRNPPSRTTPDSEIYYNFSFGIPTGDYVEIVGIEVLVSGYRQGGPQNSTATFDVSLSPDAGGSWTAAKSTPGLPRHNQGDAEFTLGSPTDLWGGSWPSGSFSDANFRLEIRPGGDQPGAAERWKLDYVGMTVYYVEHRNERTVLKFPLTAIPTGVAVTGARLKLYMEQAPADSRNYELYFSSNDGWSENTVNWNNEPTLDSALDTQATGTSSGVQLTWSGSNLKDKVIAERGGDNNLTLQIKDSTEDSTTLYLGVFTSKDTTTSNPKPVLEVDYTLVCTLVEWVQPIIAPVQTFNPGRILPVKFIIQCGGVPMNFNPPEPFIVSVDGTSVIAVAAVLVDPDTGMFNTAPNQGIRLSQSDGSDLPDGNYTARVTGNGVDATIGIIVQHPVGPNPS